MDRWCKKLMDRNKGREKETRGGGIVRERERETRGGGRVREREGGEGGGGDHSLFIDV